MHGKDILRLLPSVDQMLRKPEVNTMADKYGKEAVTRALRETLNEVRSSIMKDSSDENTVFSDIEADLIKAIKEKLRVMELRGLREIINGTGVVIHTNLGRSPMAESVAADLYGLAGKYINLEYDLRTGSRGSRHDIIKDLLCTVTGAEDAIAVNNNAAAVLLVLSALAAGKDVIVSRGELVEIGGSFRIPEVMEQGGARLIEVGTTNKTYIHDYENAISDNTGLLLKVHTSNYRICGFAEEVSRQELTALGRANSLPVVEDLGSGVLIDLKEYGIGYEPTVQASLRSGLDIVTFSGDKLLGGPQAGIIAGRAKYIEKIKRHPLSRALRVDRLTLLALESTLKIYLDKDSITEKIPVLRMLTTPLSRLEQRAGRLMELLHIAKPYGDIIIEEEFSQVGGGSLPLEMIETRVLTVKPSTVTVDELDRSLRMAETPVAGRIAKDRYMIDMRTVFDEQLPVLAEMLTLVLSKGDGY